MIGIGVGVKIATIPKSSYNTQRKGKKDENNKVNTKEREKKSEEKTGKKKEKKTENKTKDKEIDKVGNKTKDKEIDKVGNKTKDKEIDKVGNKTKNKEIDKVTDKKTTGNVNNEKQNVIQMVNNHNPNMGIGVGIAMGLTMATGGTRPVQNISVPITSTVGVRTSVKVTPSNKVIHTTNNVQTANGTSIRGVKSNGLPLSEYDKKIATLASTILDVIPVVGDLKAIYETVSGKDLVTGEKLSDMDRAISLAGVVFSIVDNVKDMAKVAKGIKGLLNDNGVTKYAIDYGTNTIQDTKKLNKTFNKRNEVTDFKVEIKGGSETVITTLGKEIDITPSTNHNSVYRNPGPYGDPNTSVDILNADGSLKTRRWYDSDGKAYKDVDMSDHGNPKEHPEVPHEHTWEYINGKVKRN